MALSSLRGGDLDVVLVEDENLIDRATRPGLQHTWLLGRPVPGRGARSMAGAAESGGPGGSSVDQRPTEERRCSSSWIGSDARPASCCLAAHACEEFAAVLALRRGRPRRLRSFRPWPYPSKRPRPGLHIVGLSEFGVRHISAVTVATRRQPPLITELLHALVEAASGSA